MVEHSEPLTFIENTMENTAETESSMARFSDEYEVISVVYGHVGSK